VRIVVCVKQVPVVSALQFDHATKTLKRDGVPTEVSAFDVRALVKAVELRDAHSGEVIAITMGPPQAREALLECLALGADRAIHLCDRAFAGADTLATARALAAALRRESFDLILCGRNSVDAETGQVGPELAELLAVPQVTGARSITVDLDAAEMSVDRETDEGIETVTVPLPALVTAAEDLAPERFPSKADRVAAQNKPVAEVHAADLGSAAEFGTAGSPTWVASLESVDTGRLGRIIGTDNPDASAAELARILVGQHDLFGALRVPTPPAISQVPRTVRRSGPTAVWVVAEEIDGTIRPITHELLGKAVELARAIGGEVSAVLLGSDSPRHAPTLAASGADRILVADDPRLTPYQTELHAAVLADAIETLHPGIVLLPATAMGRDLAPRVAARLQLGLTGDCIDLSLDGEGRLLQYKPAFGGTVVAPILSRTIPEMATVRPGVLAAPPSDPSRRPSVVALPVPADLRPRGRISARRHDAQAAVELDRAAVVVGIGMGLGDRANIDRLQPLIDLLHASVCITRDVSEAGWLPKQHQVGVTGRAIAPKLYIAIGVRGAFEHMVGVRRAGLIVAINKNPRAPVFKLADYGIVGDYAAVLPALCHHLEVARA
jgi:electron transfer flavoprotein alpha subunit